MDDKDQINEAADINVRRVHLYITNYHVCKQLLNHTSYCSRCIFIECRGHNEYI